MFKVDNRNTRRRREICLNLTIKTPARRHWRRSGISIVNFEQISHFVIINSIIRYSEICTFNAAPVKYLYSV